jgi:hypothetical protein
MKLTIFIILLFSIPLLLKSDFTNTVIDSVVEAISIDTSKVAMTDSLISSGPLKYPVFENQAFSVGEKLTFKIRYGFIRAGTATMAVTQEMELGDHLVYQIRTTARSAPAFSWIYKVEDVIYSYLDKMGLFSWRFEKRLREGSYKMDLIATYSPEDSLAKVEHIRYTDDMEVKKRDKFELKSPPFVRDVLAAFYFIRCQDLQVGKTIFMSNHDNKKIYNLEVKVYKKEILEVEAGTFRCLFIEPLLQGEGIFRQKGRLKVWLTDDQYKIPVQMKSEVIVGHITTELEKIEGLPHNIPSRIK